MPLHCNENPTYAFLFWELRTLCAASVPVSTFVVCERFIYSQDRSTYFLQQNWQTDGGNSLVVIHKSLTNTYEKEIGTVSTQFLIWEYMLRIFSIGSLQCTKRREIERKRNFMFPSLFFLQYFLAQFRNQHGILISLITLSNFF